MEQRTKTKMAINPSLILKNSFVVDSTNKTRWFADYRGDSLTSTLKLFHKLSTAQDGTVAFSGIPCHAIYMHGMFTSPTVSATPASKSSPMISSDVYFFRKSDAAFMGGASYAIWNGDENTPTSLISNCASQLIQVDTSAISQSYWFSVASPVAPPTNVGTQSITLNLQAGPANNPNPANRGSILGSTSAQIVYAEPQTNWASFKLNFTQITGYMEITLTSNSYVNKVTVNSDGRTRTYNRYITNSYRT